MRILLRSRVDAEHLPRSPESSYVCPTDSALPVSASPRSSHAAFSVFAAFSASSAFAAFSASSAFVQTLFEEWGDQSWAQLIVATEQELSARLDLDQQH